MIRIGTATVVIGVCAIMVATVARAESNSFVGRWQWSREKSAPPPGEPVPSEVTAEITRMDGKHVTWSLTVLTEQGERSAQTFDAVTDGGFYPINADAFTLLGNALQATFKSPRGETDTLTCRLSTDKRSMTCHGVISDGEGHAVNYVDFFNRK
jgi:hypothetical protein